MKHLLGFLFSLGMLYFIYTKRNTYGLKRTIATSIVVIIASILFLGQFVGGL